MASIVYQIDKKTGAKYAFESVSYWDKEKKQPRSKRKYLGKVDPETGSIIPSRGRSSSSHSEEQKPLPDQNELASLHHEIEERDETIRQLRKELDELTAKNEKLVKLVEQIRTMVEPYNNV